MRAIWAKVRRDIQGRPVQTAIIAAVIRLAQDLGMTTTAEGVETARQLASLAAAGCNQAQGFHLGKPQRRSEFEKLLGVSSVAASRRAVRR